MSETKFKKVRTDLGLTQEELSKAFGVAKLTISQYETGFRKPGPTVLILMSILSSFSKKKALELIRLLRLHADRIEDDPKGFLD